MEPRRLECPRCWCELSRGRHEDGTELLVCRKCHGALVERRSMIRVLERLAHQLVGEISPEVAVPAVADRGPIHCCPACGGDTEHFGYLGGTTVLIDTCGACDRTWLDPEELGAMALLWARTEKRGSEFDAQLRQAQPGWSNGPRTHLSVNLAVQLLLDGLLYL